MVAIRTRVTLFELLWGALRLAPRLHISLGGLLQLALLRPGQKKSIGRQIEKWARLRPEHLAVMDAHRRVTYRDFNHRANRIASLLRRCGVRRGSGVALLLHNRVDLLTAAAGTVKLGAVGVMLNHHQRGDVLAHSLRITQPHVLIVGNECREAFESVRAHLPPSVEGRVFWLADTGDEAPIDGLRDLAAELAHEAEENPPETREVSTRDAAFHIFTSGTTGLPKAAVMSHGRWLKAMTGVGLASLRMRRDDVFYCPLPLYHNNALTLSWSAALGGGATLALSRKFSASRFWDEIQQFGATAFCYIGEVCRYLLAQPRRESERGHRVRVMLGNGLRPELWSEFRQRYGIPHINEFYGASECNLLFSNAFDIQPSCGFTPLSFTVVACDLETGEPLRDAKGRLRRVRTGETGLLLSEVTARAPFDGYTSAREDEKKLLRDVFRAGDCWFNTGDVVRAQGWWHIQFVDRLGDTFRWKGENVATTEVEKVLNGFTSVSESVVYGVQVPGHEGRAGMAALTLKPGETLDGKALAHYLRTHLPEYAVPLFIRLRESHETTSTFKHQKTDLRREGYDPRTVRDPLYMLREGDTGYVPLTPDLHAWLSGDSLPSRTQTAANSGR